MQLTPSTCNSGPQPHASISHQAEASSAADAPHLSFPPPSVPALPEECIQAIADHLAKDILALHSLILVSRTFFRIALPLLYASPFDLLESHPDWSPQERTKRHASLLYLLMNCCGGATEDDIELWAGLPPVCPSFQTAHEALKTPSVDYLSAYHHHFLSMNLSSTFPILFPNIQRYPLPSQVAALSTFPSSTQQPLAATITTYTRNEIERTLLMHRPGSVRTMSLPIQRLAAFQSIGSKLSSLVRLELLGVTGHFNLEPAVEFLQQHSSLYGTIRELKVAGPNDIRLLQPSLQRIVKAIKYPKVFDLSRYKEATQDLNSFEIQNLSGLEQLLFSLDYIPPLMSPPPPLAVYAVEDTVDHNLPLVSMGSLQTLPDNTLELIQRCVNLSTLQIGIRSPTAFEWAVDRYNADPSFVQRVTVLHLSSDRTATVQQALEDCTYAFRDSLVDLKGISLKLSAVHLSEKDRPASFGWSWPLHRLTMLSLKGELALWFDLDSLRYCPKLKTLHLALYPYSPSKMDHLEKISQATQLTTLKFVGRWILTDRLIDMLSGNLLQLRKLALMGCDCDALSSTGLTRALDNMKSLKQFNVDLGARIKAVAVRYQPVRQGVEICVA